MNDLNRILHVDDELDIREITKISLHAIGGFEVESCRSGEEAVEKAVAFAPDLLLLDVMMPEMDGPATLEALRAIPELSNTPAIFMTAKAQIAEIGKLVSLGAAAVVTKPFDPVNLPIQLRDIWRHTQRSDLGQESWAVSQRAPSLPSPDGAAPGFS